MMEKTRTSYARNCLGIKVKKCCASCQFKVVTRKLTQRRCVKLDKEVDPLGFCKKWRMSKLLKQMDREPSRRLN